MRVEVRLLGRYEVLVDDVVTPPAARRSAASLVKLLALTPRHRTTAERVIDQLWPDLLLEEARPRLHKAAHYARRALGHQDAVVLRGESVALFPDQDVVVDVEQFEVAAAQALQAGPDACRRAADLCDGELLPGDLYDEWTEEARERVRQRRLELLRAAHAWEDVLVLEPVDELAHLALLRSAVDAGDRAEALRRFERMERVLGDELGIAPGPAATTLRERALAAGGPRVTAVPAPVAPAAVPSLQPLVERDEQLADLVERVRTTVATGSGAVVLVTGEAGSGKTSLVGALASRLGGTAAVLTGRCDDMVVRRTLGPFRDMADAAPGPLCDAFALGGHPEVVLPALLRLLATGPAVLVVEDVHWADDATLDALRFVTRRVTAVPAVLVLTCREDELGRTHPLRQLLGSLPATVLHRVPVPPLSVDAVAALAGDGADAEELHRVTRGNAFFVTEVLAAGGEGVPETVRDAVLARLAQLSSEAQDAVARLAVLPSRPPRALAAQLAGGRATALLDAERAGVLSGDATHLWFRHELAREAVLGILTPGEQLEAHNAVVDTLVASGEVCTDLQMQAWVVHHARAAGRADVLLSDGPRAAAEAAGIGAHRQAAETLQAVLDVGGRLPDARKAELLTRRAFSLYYVNEFEQALACATDAVAAAERAADPLLQSDAWVSLAKAAFWARGPLSARRSAERAVRLLEPLDQPVRLTAALTDLARAHSNLADSGVVAEPGGAAGEHAQRAVELADHLGRDDLRYLAMVYRGSARLDAGDPAGAAEVEDALRLATSDVRLDLKMRGCVNAAGSAYRSGRHDDAERFVDLGLRLAADGEFFGGEYRLRLTRANVHATTGRWDSAVQLLEELLRLPGDPGAMGQLACALLARLRARRGEAGAADLASSALCGPAAPDDPVIAGAVTAAAVEVAWLTGDRKAMPALAAPALRSAAAHGHRISAGEITAYLRRAGHTFPTVPTAGPWEPALAGRPHEAARAWARLGERYEHAVELVLTRDAAVAARGMRALEALGAPAAVAALSQPTWLPAPRTSEAARV